MIWKHIMAGIDFSPFSSQKKNLRYRVREKCDVPWWFVLFHPCSFEQGRQSGRATMLHLGGFHSYWMEHQGIEDFISSLWSVWFAVLSVCNVYFANLRQCSPKEVNEFGFMKYWINYINFTFDRNMDKMHKFCIYKKNE